MPRAGGWCARQAPSDAVKPTTEELIISLSQLNFVLGGAATVPKAWLLDQTFKIGQSIRLQNIHLGLTHKLGILSKKRNIR